MRARHTQTIRKWVDDLRAAACGLRQVLGSVVSPAATLRFLLALALAFGLWIHVTIRNSPDTSEILHARPLQVRGLPRELVLITSLPRVDVSIAGPRLLIEAASQLVVPYIDLTGRAAGEGQRIEIQADALNGLHRVWVNPDEVVVDLEPREWKEFRVTVETPASAPYDVPADQATLEPVTVIVSGAQSTLAHIARVVVRLDVAASPGELTQTVRPVPLDHYGREVTGPGLEISPPTVQVRLPAAPLTGRKAVPVRAVLHGRVPSGYRIATFSMTPAMVVVHGEPERLQAVTALDTEPIDISGRQTLQRSVRLKVPSGLRAEPAMVRVEVAIVCDVQRYVPTILRRSLPGCR